MKPQTRLALIDARNLISTQEHWTQGANAIENTGAECLPTDSDAYAWCADGAVRRVADETGATWKDCVDALNAAARKLFFPNAVATAGGLFVEVNDAEIGIPENVTDESLVADIAHANILRVFDEAIGA